jgi:hypothetical protein
MSITSPFDCLPGTSEANDLRTSTKRKIIRQRSWYFRQIANRLDQLAENTMLNDHELTLRANEVLKLAEDA